MNTYTLTLTIEADSAELAQAIQQEEIAVHMRGKVKNPGLSVTVGPLVLVAPTFHYFEIVGLGQGDTSDERVLWVKAPSVAVLKKAMKDLPYRSVAELPSTGFDADFMLPDQAKELADKLLGFANSMT